MSADRIIKKYVLKKGKVMASAVIHKKVTDYQKNTKLTKEKSEKLKKAIGSAPSKIDFNKAREYLKYGDY